ncbi:MBL fold metallo-hydrolase [Tepidibacillus fermentans]|uniref:MBL fold metallo-hydrolase n=1 Tax=Tepidibacillus fermentans TaxID=1281767 RepID=UPI00104B0F92|nr:MBL fold metallo-hydrolase [Tepidibacillus fermentans]
MRYRIIASGSTGNSIYIGTDQHHFLVDAGLSGKKIEMGLKEIGVNPKDLNGIFITHEHDDHIRGIGVLARKYQIPLYANERTLNGLPSHVGQIDESLKRIMDTGSVIEFGNLQIESYAISHDAVEPVGYLFRHQDLQLSILTDSGYVSEKMKQKIKGSDILIFEANHDVEMLRMSRYPWSVKQRILGDSGHLSNEASGEALADVITSDTQKVFLAHLSRENNLPELARLTVATILKDYGITEKDVQIMDTYHDKPTSLEELKEKRARILF